MVLCHPRWLPTSGLTEFAVCWGGAGFKPRTTDLQSGALPCYKMVQLQNSKCLKMARYKTFVIPVLTVLGEASHQTYMSQLSIEC
jgi:hypothetical protein